MFLDHVTIQLASGQGGNGAIAWRREKFVAYGGPAGGDGGMGGSIYLVADDQMQTLIDFKYQRHYEAESGVNGQQKNMHGKKGQDLIIRVPCGTVVKDPALGQAIADLTEPGQQILVAKGGRGGRGNARFASSCNKAPYYAEPGEAGIQRTLTLELKLIAQVGLIGMPNAGKSTLISVISAARPKIASYPFTTLQPNLGVVRRPSGDGVVVADIPGLIEGASEGVGLGHDFLRHVERTRLLLHLVDVSATDGGTPWDNYQLIQRELACYSPRLARKPQLVILTKTDTVDAETVAQVRQQFEQQLDGVAPFVLSAATGDGVSGLVASMLERLDSLTDEALDWVPIVQDPIATATPNQAYEVEALGDGHYRIDGDRVRRWLEVTDMSHHASLKHLFDILKAMGVMDALLAAGIQAGDTVYLGESSFIYYPDDDTAPRARRKTRDEKRAAAEAQKSAPEASPSDEVEEVEDEAETVYSNTLS